MADQGVYIERGLNGQFVVKREGAERASALFSTQEDAISYARRTYAGHDIHVERVRSVGPGRDRWRKI